MAITKPTRNMLSTGISDSSNATFLTADSDEHATFAGNLIVTGNLTVSGTQTVVSSTVETHADPLIELNTGAGSNSNDLGFVFERGSTGDNACLIWDESADVFTVGTTTATGTPTGNMSTTPVGFTAGVGTFSSLDISGNADIDGTLEADVITVDGTALNEYIADTVGAMFSSNTETNITATYQDSDNTIDLVVAGSGVTAMNNATADELVTVGSTTTELDAEANLTFDGTTLVVRFK